MPRAVKATAREVQKSRLEWYTFHYENRQRAQLLAADTIQRLINACEHVRPPTMTVFGGLEHDYPERAAYELAAAWHIDVNLINPWYLTSEGWEQFQCLWQQLPEPVDILNIPCVQIGELYTVSTMPAESHPPRA